jgi:hypothetical protein
VPNARRRGRRRLRRGGRGGAVARPEQHAEDASRLAGVRIDRRGADRVFPFGELRPLRIDDGIAARLDARRGLRRRLMGEDNEKEKGEGKSRHDVLTTDRRERTGIDNSECLLFSERQVSRGSLRRAIQGYA